MSKHTVQRPRHLGEIQRFDEQAGVPDLPAAATAHEAPKLLLICASSPCRLLLERAEGSKLSLGGNDPFYESGAESADQLVLQVDDAHIEAECFHVGAGEIGAEAGPLERALEVSFLCGVTETREPDVQPSRAKQIQEAPNGLRTPNRHDGNSLGVQVPTTAFGERFQCTLIADPLDEHNRPVRSLRLAHRRK
jgi:hypothetical protein